MQLKSNSYNAHDGGVAAALSLLDAEHNEPEEDNEDDYDFINDDPRSSEANKLVHQLVKEAKEDPNSTVLSGSVEVQEPAEVTSSSSSHHLPSRKHIAKWTSRIFASASDLEALEIEKRHKLELQGEGHGLLGFGSYGLKRGSEEPELPLEEAVRALVNAVIPKEQTYAICRTHFCQAMNNSRSKKTSLSPQGYAGLSDVMLAFLDGCTESTEDVANSKMMMMLSQSFYKEGEAR